MKITKNDGLIQIEDLGLGEMRLLDLGSTYQFEILSTFDGSTIGEITCENVKEFICENALDKDDQEVFGSFIPLTIIKEVDDINKEKFYNYSGDNRKYQGFLMTMGETDINIRVVCLNIKVNIEKIEMYEPFLVKN